MHVVIAGAGVAGTSTAMHLTRLAKHARVTLLDARPPLTGTSQYSSECYRSFFMDSAVVPLMQRSIELMEDIHARHNISMNRKGYVFLTGSEQGTGTLQQIASRSSAAGAGPIRVHQSAATYVKSPEKGLGTDLDGFDLLQDRDEILKIFPFVNPEVTSMLHCRKAGWLDAQQLGRVYISEAKENGAKVVSGTVMAIDKSASDGSVKTVRYQAKDGSEGKLDCDVFINASGAWLQTVNELVGAMELPVVNSLIAKVILKDVHGVIPQSDCPFMVWRDPTTIPWSEDHAECLIDMDDTHEPGGVQNCASWLKPQPGGQHLRPLGNNRIMLLWEHVHRHLKIGHAPSMPVEYTNPLYPELAVQGCKFIAPGLGKYADTLGKDTHIDAGYYCSTNDGRPIVGQHGPPNSFVVGGMGGWGIMSSSAVGELGALHATESKLPAYAYAFTLPRLDPLEGPVIDLLDPSENEDEAIVPTGTLQPEHTATHA
ncbi:hypothetical protein DIPPA_01776 [Diplonema papillatum]|nr:hypothetical protein DIPPA_01776 [Diplonema papillatum]|eukprot:gene857-1318_t